MPHEALQLIDRRARHDGLALDQVKPKMNLEQENVCLKHLVANLSLENLMLKGPPLVSADRRSRHRRSRNASTTGSVGSRSNVTAARAFPSTPSGASETRRSGSWKRR